MKYWIVSIAALAILSTDLLLGLAPRSPLQLVAGQSSQSPTVAICAIVKDDPDILEWLQHYLESNATRVLLFDNGSRHWFKGIVLNSSYVHDGFVVYHRFPAEQSKDSPQIQAYNACLIEYRHAFDFMAFFDADEFVAIPSEKSLPELLAPYATFGALALNWRSYASNGFNKRPTGGLLKNYHQCFPESHSNNWHVKSIVNTRFVSHMQTPHSAVFMAPHYAVNTNFTRVDGPFSRPAVFDVAYLKHFQLKSRQDYARKLARGQVDTSQKGWKYFDVVEKEATEHCE